MPLPLILAAGAALAGGLLSSRARGKRHGAEQAKEAQQQGMSEDARLARLNFLLSVLGGRGAGGVVSPEMRKRLQTRREHIPVPSGESFLGTTLSSIAPFIGPIAPFIGPLAGSFSGGGGAGPGFAAGPNLQGFASHPGFGRPGLGASDFSNINFQDLSRFLPSAGR